MNFEFEDEHREMAMKCLGMVAALALSVAGCNAQHDDVGRPDGSASTLPRMGKYLAGVYIDGSAVIPVEIASSGVLTTGKVKDWEHSVNDNDEFSRLNLRMAKGLEKRSCVVTMQVIQNREPGKYYSTDSPAKLICMSRQGEIVEILLHGTLTDSAGRSGASSISLGEKMLYLINGQGIDADI